MSLTASVCAICAKNFLVKLCTAKHCVNSVCKNCANGKGVCNYCSEGWFPPSVTPPEEQQLLLLILTDEGEKKGIYKEDPEAPGYKHFYAWPDEERLLNDDLIGWKAAKFI